MKKFAVLLCALFLVLGAIPAHAADGAFVLTLCVDGETSHTEPVTAYTLPEATTSVAGRVFVGWRTEAGALYAAGETLTLSADTTLTAMFVTMQVNAPEFRCISETDTGLRFLTNVDRAELEALQSLCRVKIGTLIVPKFYVNKDFQGALSPELLEAAGRTKYLDVPAEDFYRTTESTCTIAGSVRNIRPENAITDFVGVGYLELNGPDGSVRRIYAPVDRKLGGDYYTALCGVQETGVLGETGEIAARLLEKIVAFDYTSSSKYSKGVGSSAFDLTFHKHYSYDGDFVLTVKEGRDFRFDRDMWVLIVNGAVLPESHYTILENGRILAVTYKEYTSNY